MQKIENTDGAPRVVRNSREAMKATRRRKNARLERFLTSVAREIERRTFAAMNSDADEKVAS